MNQVRGMKEDYKNGIHPKIPQENMGIHPKIPQENPDQNQIINNCCIPILKTENLPEFLEFIEWLKKNYRNSPINHATSHQKIKEIVTQFCLELNYENVQQFSKEVINWLLPTYRHKIINLLLIEVYPRPEIINRDLSEFIERYETIHFHSIFLFGENNNLSAFIKHHGRDLHYLTDEYLDIYYSQDDIKHNATAYQRRRQFRNLDVEISHIPAFIIWKNSLTNSHVISLEGLSHQQMFEVVKHITSGIEEKKSLDEVSQIGRDKVESYLNYPNRPPINTVGEINIGNINKPTLYAENYHNQGDTMSDKSSNFKFGNVGGDVAGVAGGDISGVAGKDQTGVAGGAISGTVTASIGQLTESEAPETPKLAELLTQLQSAIASDTHLSEKDKAKALKQIQALTEAGQNPKDEDKKNLADTAITMLKGVVSELPVIAAAAKACKELLPLIRPFFGL